jgi:hypothetical protein
LITGGEVVREEEVSVAMGRMNREVQCREASEDLYRWQGEIDGAVKIT